MNPTIITTIPTPITSIPTLISTEANNTTLTNTRNNISSKMPSLTPSMNQTINSTLLPTINPILNIMTVNHTETPSILPNKDTHPQIVTQYSKHLLIWMILFSIVLAWFICCLVAIFIIFWRNKKKSKDLEKEADTSIHQSKIKFKNKHSSMEIIEGKSTIANTVKSEYQIKVFQHASFYIDKQRTPSNNFSAEGRTQDVITHKNSTPGHGNVDITINDDMENEVELIYAKR